MFLCATCEKNWKSNLIVLLLCIAVGVGRFFVPTHDLSLPGTYEAFAHLLVGGLIGAWLVTRNGFYGSLVLFLSAIELFKFFNK